MHPHWLRRRWLAVHHGVHGLLRGHVAENRLQVGAASHFLNFRHLHEIGAIISTAGTHIATLRGRDQDDPESEAQTFVRLVMVAE